MPFFAKRRTKRLDEVRVHRTVTPTRHFYGVRGGDVLLPACASAKMMRSRSVSFGFTLKTALHVETAIAHPASNKTRSTANPWTTAQTGQRQESTGSCPSGPPGARAGLSGRRTPHACEPCGVANPQGAVQSMSCQYQSEVRSQRLERFESARSSHGERQLSETTSLAPSPWYEGGVAEAVQAILPSVLSTGSV